MKYRYCLRYIVEDLHGKVTCFVCIPSRLLVRSKPFLSSLDVLPMVVKKSTHYQAYRY
jgi:hypothetical protein